MFNGFLLKVADVKIELVIILRRHIKERNADYKRLDFGSLTENKVNRH